MKMAPLPERITAYLANGGLFNPELANHEAVRDLLIDCRAALSALGQPSAVVGKIVLFGGDADAKEVAWTKGVMPPVGTRLLAAAQAAGEQK